MVLTYSLTKSSINSALRPYSALASCASSIASVSGDSGITGGLPSILVNDSILKAFNASAKIQFEKILPFSIFTNKIDYDKKQHLIVPKINKHEEQVIEKISFADMQKYIEQIYNK